MSSQRVLSWVSSLPYEYQPDESQAPPTKKRKATQQEPSPPSTLFEMDVTPKRKRQRPLDIDLGGDESELTPRASVSSRSSPTASSSASASNSGLRSRSSSPLKKQLMGLRLDAKGIEFRQLSVEAAPVPSAAELLNAIYSTGSNGLDLLPHAERDRIFNSPALQGLNTTLWRHSFREPGDADTLPGRIPSPEEVALIHDRAEECYVCEHEEASWNSEVHHRILEAVFRIPGSGKGDPFNFMTCTTARPHSSWLPRSSVGPKMVDFCIHADISDDQREAGLAVCRRTSTLSINHTDYQPLQMRPIVLSIETKKPGKEMKAAELQIGVWHSSQWAFLHSVLALSMQSKAAAQNQEELLENFQEQADKALVPFLPGILVLGHEWYLVLSTRDRQGKTTLWTKQRLGSTTGIQEIYKIVAGLRELAAWARDVYVPWFYENILSGFNEQDVQ